MKSNHPFPNPPRPIVPSFKRRLASFCIGLMALILRILTAPWRWTLAQKKGPQSQAPIFFYEPYGMGDIVALQPLICSFLASGYSVILASKPAWGCIIPPHPQFTFLAVSPAYTQINASQKYQHIVQQIRALIRTLAPLARGSVAIDVRGDVRSLVILYLAGCRSIQTLTHYWTATDTPVLPGAAHRYPFRRDVSRRLVNATFAPDSQVAFPRPSLQHLFPTGLIVPDASRIGLIPLTPWIGKQWFPDAWQELIRKLQQLGFSPVILCGPHEKAQALAATQTSSTSSASLECLESQSVSEWIARILKCRAIITVNTGPMHLADALLKPLIVLEGGSRLPLWAPENPSAVVLHAQQTTPCAPCHQVGPATCGRKCLAQISPTEVLSTLKSLLAQN